jgi:predicted nicotinamide N-methyase
MPSSKVRIISIFIKFVQSPSYDIVLCLTLTGLYLWPGAERLCRFAAYNPHLFAQKRVIELGAGAGLGSAVHITPSS